MRGLLCATQAALAILLVPGCGKTDRVRLFRTAAPVEGLAVGQRAPDIDGEDLDGVPFRLSDYRGRVVALVFWGEW